MPLFRRSNVYRPENEKDESTEKKSSPEQIGEVASEDIPTLSEGEITYSKLVTAYGNSEIAVIESILRSAQIPYVLREGDRESWSRVILGYNTFGYDVYVPTELLDDAAALLVPEEAEGTESEESPEGDGADA